MSVGPEAAPSNPAPEGGRRARRAAQTRNAKSRRRVSALGVIGEVLITAGAVVLLFIGWQLWISELIVGSEQQAEAQQLGQEWNEQAQETPAPAETPTPEATPDPTETDPPDLPDAAAPPVQTAPANATKFAALIVPRWGADYYRTIAEGVGTKDVLDRGKLGHYPSTQMPGEVGNFAIAAHRMGHGGSLHHIHELQLGDHVFVETAAGWYEYSFRNLEYVTPQGIGVIAPVPQDLSAAPTERYITLTSCNPQYTSNERIIAYGIFDRFYPRDPAAPNFGAPDEIAATVKAEA